MRKIDIFLLVAFSCSAAAADIDLTPIPSFRELEGCKFPQLEFREGAKTITYETPKGWRYVARDPHTIMLYPPNTSVVSARIQYMRSTAPLLLDEPQMKFFKDSASTLLPPDSQIIGEPNITPRPLEINGHTTCEIDVLFVLHGERLHLSVLFVDLGQNHLRFTLVSRASDFGDLHKLFQQSWYTWQWIDKSPAPFGAG